MIPVIQDQFKEGQTVLKSFCHFVQTGVECNNGSSAKSSLKDAHRDWCGYKEDISLHCFGGNKALMTVNI